MYLVDSNVWLERLLGQPPATQVAQFLAKVPSHHLYITDFAFHSIGVILYRMKKIDSFQNFAQDMFIDGSVNMVSLEPSDTSTLIHSIKRYSLDFDDAYQYTAAEKYNLVVVSFDAVFGRTARGKRTPAEVVADLGDAN